MPVHDWTRVPAGIFHHFHNQWITMICAALNDGRLPAAVYALMEQDSGPYIPDAITLEREDPGQGGASPRGGVLVRPIQTEVVSEAEMRFPQRQRSVVLHHITDDRILAMVEVVSPGNKSSQAAFGAFLEKAIKLLASGIHLLIVDVLPRGTRDPQGIPGAIWAEIGGPPIALAPDRPLTLTSYEANGTARAYIETRAVGADLPTMPLFLEPGGYVNVPLEETYNAAYQHVPRLVRGDLDRP